MTDKTNDLKKTYTDKLWDNEEDWTAAKDIDDSEADDWDLPEISDEIDPDEEGQDINETVINPPAELGRLTDARCGERSNR